MADREFEELEGDAALLANKAARYVEIAAAIERSLSTLDAISDEIDQKSLSMDAVRALAGDVRSDIAKAEGRYAETGDALATYAGVLDEQKSTADAAAKQLRTVESDLYAARIRLRWAENDESGLRPDATEQERDEARSAVSSTAGAVTALEADVAALQKAWRDAHDAKNAAATTAVAQIDDVVTGANVNGLEDSTWDKARHALGKLYEAFKLLCEIAGFLAIFLSWVPVLGQVLIVLAAIGAILAVVEAIVKVSQGEGTGWDIAKAAGFAALSLFGGRAVSGLAKVVKARVVVNAAQRVGPAAVRAQAGSTVMTQAYRVAGQTAKQRTYSLLKSPFVRDAAQREAFRTFQTSSTKWATGWSNVADGARKAFPNPFKDSAKRFALGNDDVVDLLAAQTDSFYTFTAADHMATSVAAVGAITLRGTTGTLAAVGFGTAVAGGDGWGIADSAGGIATQPLDGSYGSAFAAVVSGHEIVEFLDDVDVVDVPVALGGGGR
ncbi:hypothetical protein GCM10025865_05490 [Paraoerskovia sediminicola]|uniref:Uncharacterized protein n=1 Tax=Paraoerskovia sediminicola TaxID=1138587 RepID=A0ABN6XBW2_9CELL|nr:hypothetical protein [Paraoerskovia sediminicola]BDZ41250.1 hypothetical protein GCM10025865_05490 [Paraoerskovia sediminicola]